MNWLLDNLEWLVGAIISIIGLFLGGTIVNKKLIQKNKKSINNIQIGKINVKK